MDFVGWSGSTYLHYSHPSNISIHLLYVLLLLSSVTTARCYLPRACVTHEANSIGESPFRVYLAHPTFDFTKVSFIQTMRVEVGSG